jgi:hypothetical protein
MNPTRWVALHCGEEAATLLARHPNAFLLLCQIAMRARWKDCPITKLKAGEAFIGDWKECGLRSEMAYRCAKNVLTDCHLATFKGTNKGTRARLLTDSVFSLSPSSNNGPDNIRSIDPTNTRGTDGQRSSNDPTTTTHTENKEHPDTLTTSSKSDLFSFPADMAKAKGTPRIIPDLGPRGKNFSVLDIDAPSLPEEEEAPESKPDLLAIVAAYPRRENERQCLEHLAASLARGADPDAVLMGTRAIAAVIQQRPSGHLNGYTVSASNFFKDERWRDDPATWNRNTGSKSGAVRGELNLGGRRPASTTRLNAAGEAVRMNS